MIEVQQAKLAGNPSALALDAAHSLAFHNGLGSPIYPSLSSSAKNYLDEYALADFAEAAYAKPNIALVADGAAQSNLSQWADKFFSDVPASSSGKLSVKSTPSTYYGGEQRIDYQHGNSVVIAFPGSSASSSSPEVAVLTALLGGESGIKWSSGFSLVSKIAAATGASGSATNLKYSDTGLLAVQLSGSAPAVRKAAEETANALRSVAAGSVSKEDLAKAIGKAKFDVLDAGDSLLSVGSSLVHGTQPVQAANLAKSFEAVTPQKLQSVSLTESSSASNSIWLTTIPRLPRLCSTARPPSRRLVTSTSYPSRKSWVSEYRIEVCGGSRQCSITPESLEGEEPESPLCEYKQPCLFDILTAHLLFHMSALGISTNATYSIIDFLDKRISMLHWSQ